MTHSRSREYWHGIAEWAIELLRLLIADNSEANKKKATAFLGQFAREQRATRGNGQQD